MSAHSTISCSFPSCGRKILAKGLCSGHYNQQRKKGRLQRLFSERREPGSPPRIEWDESPCPNHELEGPCHIFRGAKLPGGYGSVGIGKGSVLVHRYIWERDVGPIPKGLLMDHRCRNRACCNILHLRLVTPQVNTTENSESLAAKNKLKTHCPKGHAYTKENVYSCMRGRNCKICVRARVSARKQRLKEAAKTKLLT